MFKRLIIGALALVLVSAVAVGAYDAFKAQPAEAQAATGRGGNGNGQGQGYGGGQTAATAQAQSPAASPAQAEAGTAVLDIPVSEMSADEAASLLYMREEEKLARDVYTALYAIWGQPSFQNIAASEQQHTEQVKLLLERYALTDPALEPGQFTDPALQALYDQLAAQGSASLADALKVGAAIEEIDILNLQTRLAQTDNADIQLVYNNLMSGSYSHLQAFTGVLAQQTGEVYQPQYLSAEAYQSIITSAAGNGNSGNQGGNGNGQGGNSASSGTAIPNTQWTPLGATVQAVELTGLSVLTDDGQPLWVQLGPNRFWTASIGFAVGDHVTVTGFTENGQWMAAVIVNDTTGQSFTLRSDTGQPLWTGGNGNH